MTNTNLPAHHQASAQVPQPAPDGQDTDDAALATWLGFVSLRNQNTFRSYRAEVARFRIFLATVHQNTPGRDARTLLRDATELDVAYYEAQLGGKLRTGEDVPPLLVPREILNRYGRQDQPFVQVNDKEGIATIEPIRLKATSVNLALSILHAMYAAWLLPDPRTRVAYVGANPVHRVRTSSNRATRQSDRVFPVEGIEAMLGAIDLEAAALAADQVAAAAPVRSQQEAAKLARRRWIVALLFGLWARRGEIAKLRMNDFTFNGKHWKVQLHRKGGKDQELIVAPWVMEELMRYRQSLGMASLPSSDDDSGAVGRLFERKGAKDEINDTLIYREAVSAAKGAAAAVRAGQVLPDMPPPDREMLAARLDAVSPHWFRHSGATYAINSNQISLGNASKFLGHTSTSITEAMYYHADDEQLAAGLQAIGNRAFR